MYRYSVDRAVTYTSEDIVLFRESPFACWMERLCLENPDHGIAPDSQTARPTGYVQRQDELAATLRDEGKQVALIDWDAEEQVRRRETLEAMRSGTDYIVNGQLALGPLSGAVNLLMRTTGYSDLGAYLYIPCDTQAKTTLNSAFRLCFAADLLHSLQGQLPPQMLIIRGDADLLPLHTEDHIYCYRAVKQRFMNAMRDFRKHRMPDPAESSHFGRWSDCAHALIKQRALREEQAEGTGADNNEAESLAALAASEPVVASEKSMQPRIAARGIPVGDTLAAQARRLVKTASVATPAAAAPAPAAERRLDAALENLEFIGSSGARSSLAGQGLRPPTQTPPPQAALHTSAAVAPAQTVASAPPRTQPFERKAVVSERPRAEVNTPSEATPAPTLNTHSRAFEVDCIDDSDYQMPSISAETPPAPEAEVKESRVDVRAPTRPFSSNLNTSNFPEDLL
ncbi:hypothetical protein F0M18_00285 [Pseudohalioglobus sediminis]|uniref:Uncharacterized protein n=1 Tax=Pseudohalioglobus sediminis TaxID=2606449 RepID=A0A5B0X6G6_9GAMM|nr:hypothetical protein [Pseudohalioglobus sediminis]KAA1193921.1 hypothetical protein F0M18_00285 [Pseudohalioglobus sediminis]